MILHHLLQPLVQRIPFFKDNITICVAFLVVMDIVFGFMVLAIGTEECEAYFSNYLKLDIGISILSALFLLFGDYISRCEYTLIGMQILENFHNED